MRKILFAFLLITLLQYSCNSKEKSDTPNSALETGTTFIQSSLEGNFSKCEMLLVGDKENVRLFNKYKIVYQKKPENWKNSLKTSGYIINKYIDLNDSTTIINYSSPILPRAMEIKVVLINKQWRVDYKYTFSGNLPID